MPQYFTESFGVDNDDGWVAVRRDEMTEFEEALKVQAAENKKLRAEVEASRKKANAESEGVPLVSSTGAPITQHGDLTIIHEDREVETPRWRIDGSPANAAAQAARDADPSWQAAVAQAKDQFDPTNHVQVIHE
jgi:hypothetical protein